MNTIAIIGGGAAGLMAAISAARAGADVTVFEQNAEAGKKILASGNGKCNIINRHANVEDFEGEVPHFCTAVLAAMPYKKFDKFCKGIGLLLEEKRDGKCYPLSQEARSVQSALIRTALAEGVHIEHNSFVADIEHTQKRFLIQTGNVTRSFDRLIIATGSPAAPQLGGNDSGINMARRFGHNVVSTFPSLVGLHLDSPSLSKMAGAKMEAQVTLIIDNEPIKTQVGDILFTKYGISGFAILDLSHQASEALTRYAFVALQLDLLQRFPMQSLASQIEQMANNIGSATLYELLCGLLPHKVIRALLQSIKISPELPCEHINTKTAKSIAYAIKHWRFTVTDTHGYHHAEVAGGGVSTDEIDPKTMESKKIPGLYFAGEVIDITGHRGGFNFHFAWGSGYLAGMNSAKR